MQSLSLISLNHPPADATPCSLQPGPPLDLNSMADLFLQRNMVREATAFLLDVLQDNDPKNAVLQTKLLEINLITNPQASYERYQPWLVLTVGF